MTPVREFLISRPIEAGFSRVFLLIVLVYAGLGEFHQLFVPYRIPAFMDVLLDLSGGVIGLFVAAISIGDTTLISCAGYMVQTKRFINAAPMPESGN